MVKNLTPKESFENLFLRVGTEEFSDEKKRRTKENAAEVSIKKEEISVHENKLAEEGFEKKEKGETKHRFKYVRKKKPEDALEDRIWLFFEKLGATLLNKYEYPLVIDNSGKTKKFDVIAKIDEVVYVIECKYSSDPSRPLRKELAETAGYKKIITDLCREVFGDDVRVCFAYVLDGIKLSDSDASDAKNYDIKVWSTSSTIPYFEDLRERLSKSAKYQIFAETFGENEEISGYSPSVPAIKSSAGSNTFYCFLARPESLLKIAYIYHRKMREDRYENAYQRMVNKKRIEDIREFIKNGGYFGNSIVVNFRKTPTFEDVQHIEGIEYGKLVLPNYYKSAWVIDGQHRLFGYTDTVNAKNDLIPVVAFEGLSEDKQGQLFIDINLNQKSVESNLLWDLYSDIYYGSRDKEKELVAMISLVGKELNRDPASPFYGHIYVPSMNERDEATNITLTTICNRLRKGSFFRRKDEEKGDLYFNSSSETVEFASKRLMHYFTIVKKANEDDWKSGENGFSRSNIGVNIHLLVFQEILKYFRSFTKNPVGNDASFVKEMKECTAPLIKFLENISQDDIRSLTISSNEGGFFEGAKRICKIINSDYPSFAPEILRGEVEEEAAGTITNPNQKIDSVEKKIREYLHVSLMERHGPDYWQKNEVIPTDIKDSVDKKIKDEMRKYPFKHETDYQTGERKIQFCDIMDYQKIITKNTNWEIFSKKFRSKEILETKFKELNDYRNAKKHGRTDEEIDQVIDREGEAAVIWFGKVLEIEF